MGNKKAMPKRDSEIGSNRNKNTEVGPRRVTTLDEMALNKLRREAKRARKEASWKEKSDGNS